MRSRKNRVFRSVLRGNQYVVKVFREAWRERAQVEFEVLSECRNRGVPAPVPVALLGDAVVMEYVEGDSVADVFDRSFSSSEAELDAPQKALAHSLASWLSTFHAAFAFRLARGDTILRNFVIAQNGIMGLDFEEAGEVDTIGDLGQLCASALMTDPSFTPAKRSFAGQLSERYWEFTGRDRSADLPKAVAASIRYYAQYRQNMEEQMKKAGMVEEGRLLLI